MFLPIYFCVFQPMDNHSRHAAGDSGKVCKRLCRDHEARRIFQQPESCNTNNSVQTDKHHAISVALFFDTLLPI
jgi:hypothetical protein